MQTMLPSKHRVAEKQLPLLPRIHGDQNRAISEKLSLLHRYRKPRPPIPVVKRRGRIPKQKKWQEDGRDTHMIYFFAEIGVLLDTQLLGRNFFLEK